MYFFLCIFILLSLFKIMLLKPISNEYHHQEALCKIFNEEMEITAKATISNNLKEFCLASDLEMKFKTLHEELQQIKNILLGADFFNNNNDTIIISENTDAGKKIENLEEKRKFSYNEEIEMFNNTIIASADGDLFFYYWKIIGIQQYLRKNDIYISSPAFSVLGHTLFLQFYPNYLNEHVVGILLNTSSKSFLKKHKISYIGQKTDSLVENQISSRIIYGNNNNNNNNKENKMFVIKLNMLDWNFIYDNTLLIQVKIYLNS